MWPSAVMLSTLIVKENWITDFCGQNASNALTKSVLEIGAGCGLSGLVAALHLQKLNLQNNVRVILTDFNSLVLENLQRNIDLNNLSDICSVAGLDFYQQTGQGTGNWIAMNGTQIQPVDLVLGADIICEPADAVAVANTLQDVLKPDGIAYIVCADAKHRFGVDHLHDECQRVGLSIDVVAISCDENKDNLGKKTINVSEEDIQNLELTTGFVKLMNLTLFIIKKQ
jgi:predicted nicotinamide N-methyase